METGRTENIGGWDAKSGKRRRTSHIIYIYIYIFSLRVTSLWLTNIEAILVGFRFRFYGTIKRTCYLYKFLGTRESESSLFLFFH